MLTQQTSITCITAAHELASTVQPVYARPDAPYLTDERARAQPYIDPHMEFVPTTHEHLRAMCDQHDYTTVHDAITPAHLIHLDPIDLRRIFWLVELHGDLRELCRVDRSMTFNELLHWASTPHIAVMLQTPRLHPDCYLPTPPVDRTSGAADVQPTPTVPSPPIPPVPTQPATKTHTPKTTSRSTAAAAWNTKWSERDSNSQPLACKAGAHPARSEFGIRGRLARLPQNPPLDTPPLLSEALREVSPECLGQKKQPAT